MTKKLTTAFGIVILKPLVPTHGGEMDKNTAYRCELVDPGDSDSRLARWVGRAVFARGETLAPIDGHPGLAFAFMGAIYGMEVDEDES